MSEDRQSNENDNTSWVTKITNAFSGDPQNPQELLELLREAEKNRVIDADMLSIIEGAMQVNDMQVREIMVPRSKIVMVNTEDRPADFLPSIIESGHSRFPVIDENIDDIEGILLAKDLLPLILNNKQDKFNIKDVTRPAIVVPESKRLNILLAEFRANHNHMAIVIDEYGSTSGIVTIEDVLEQIVGEIEDEFDIDDDDSYIKKFDDNNFIVKALTPIDEFNEHFATEFSEDEFDTIGGIVMQHFGHLPRRNETTQIDNLQVQVLNADNRRIRLLRVTQQA